jgi:WD40 repeat protein
VAFDPDGRHLAVAMSWTENGDMVCRVSLIAVADGVTRHFDLGRGVAAAVALGTHPQGGLTLAASSVSGPVRLWSPVVAGQAQRIVEGLEHGADALAFSPDGQWLAAARGEGSRGSVVRLWDARDGKRRETPPDRHPDRHITALAYSSKGGLLAAGGDRGTVAVWQPGTGRPSRLLKGRFRPALITAMDFSEDDRVLAVGGDDHAIRLWDLDTGQLIDTFKGHDGPVSALAFGPDGQTLASAGWDHRIRLWNISTLPVDAVRQQHRGQTHDLAFSPDGRWLVTVGADGAAKVWDPRSGELRGILFQARKKLTAVTFSRRGKLALAGDEGQVWLWERPEGLPSLGPRIDAVGCLAFAPEEEEELAIGSASGKITLWRVGAGARLLRRWDHPGGPDEKAIYRLAYSPDGHRLASAGQDGTVRLWNRTLQQIALWSADSGKPIWSVAFSPAGRHLAAGCSDQRVVLLPAHGLGELPAIEVFQGHRDEVHSVAFSADGLTLASGSRDRTVRLWGVRSRQLHATLRDQDDRVVVLAFSPPPANSRTRHSPVLASGGAEGTLRFRHAASYQEGGDR